MTSDSGSRAQHRDVKQARPEGRQSGVGEASASPKGHRPMTTHPSPQELTDRDSIRRQGQPALSE